MENRLLTSRRKAAARKTRPEERYRWHSAQATITDVAVQVGSLINGVCSDARDLVSPQLANVVTIRFSWTGSMDTGNHHGQMRIGLSLADESVRVAAVPLDMSGGRTSIFENVLSLADLSSQKLGQVLMDAYEHVIRQMTPLVCPVSESQSPGGPDDSIWNGMRSLAITQTGELATQR